MGCRTAMKKTSIQNKQAIVIIILFLCMSFHFVSIRSEINHDYQQKTLDFYSLSHPATAEEINQMKELANAGQSHKNLFLRGNNRFTGYTAPNEKEWEDMVGTLRIIDSTRLGKIRSSSIDLTVDPCFPKVGDQGTQGSCASWAATYYAMGYVHAKQCGWTEASMGNTSQLLSPAFTYNKANTGEDSGSSFWGIGQIMNDIGICRWTTMPYDENDHIHWGNESAWREAPLYRVENIYGLSYPYNDSSVNAIKTILSAGTPAVFALNSASYTNFGSDDVLGSADLFFNVTHANCIIGYNDSKEDVDSDETGAFKVVNSWGENWGPTNDGYYWLTYDAFTSGIDKINSATWFDIFYNTSNNEHPNLIATWEYSSAPYRDAAVELGIGNYTNPITNKTPWWDGYNDTNHAYPSFMCLDITEFSENLSQGHSNFFLNISNSTDQNGTISSFHVEYYQDDYLLNQTDQITANSQNVPTDTPGIANVSFAATITAPNPINESTEIMLHPSCSVTIDDIDKGTATINFYENTSGSWVLQQQNTSINLSNPQTILWNEYTNATEYNTTYWWKAVVTDDEGWITEAIYHFTTAANNPPQLVNEVPTNASSNTDPSPICNVTIIDTNQDFLSLFFYENSSGQWMLQQTNHSAVNNTSIIWNQFINATAFNTTYWWKICATDGSLWTNETYYFTTRSAYNPSPPASITATTHNRTVINLTWTPGSNATQIYIEYNTTANWTRGQGFGQWNYSTAITAHNHTHLEMNKRYYYQAWSYNETDRVWSQTKAKDDNTTHANTAPLIQGEQPQHTTRNIALNQTMVNVTITDDDSDQLHWNITIFSSNQTRIASQQGTQSFPGSIHCVLPTPLDIDEKIHWQVNITDGYEWTNETFWFTTPLMTASVDDDYDNTTEKWNLTTFNQIQPAINALATNGTVLVNNGTYHEQLIINKSLTLQANTFSSPVIDAKAGMGLNISSNHTHILNLNIKNASSAIALITPTSYQLHHISIINSTIETSTTCIFSNASLDNQTITITQNVFSKNNTHYAINVSTIPTDINATENYWGSITGPYHETKNPHGTGLHISDHVQYTPWRGTQGGTISHQQFQINQTIPGFETVLSALSLAKTMITVNSTSQTNISIATYDQQPDQIPINLSTIGKTIDIEIQNQSHIIWPINITIYYTQQDLNNANLNETSLDGLYYYNTTEKNWKKYQTTAVNTTNITLNGVWYEGYCWAQANQNEISPKTIGNENNPPSQPTNPSPNATNNIGRNPLLQLTVYDVDGNNVSVFFIDNTTDNEIGNQTNVRSGNTATTTWSNRAYQTTYEWYVIINDSRSEIRSSVYQFSTKSAPQSNDNPSSGYQALPPVNQEPIADAGASFQTYVNCSIKFDASNSTDDGIIMNYTWDFGDGTMGYGSQPVHIYAHPGNYTVTLTITDDEKSSATDTTTIKVISQQLIAPNANANGPYIGVVNITLTLDGSASFDQDGDITSYIWKTERNQTITGKNPTLQYPKPGIYSLMLTIYDSHNLTDSDTTMVTIYQGEYIDLVDGYIIDTDYDGTIDSYMNKTNELSIPLKSSENGCYFIDVTGEGTHSYMYDPATGEVTPYQPISTTEETDYAWIIYIIFIAVTIIIIFIALVKTGIIFFE